MSAAKKRRLRVVGPDEPLAPAAVLGLLRRDLGIQPWQHGRIRELELYLEATDAATLVRQVELGKTRRRCCWAHVDEPHHPACPIGRREASE